MAASLDNILSTAKNIVTALSSIHDAILRGQGNITSPTVTGAGPHLIVIGPGYVPRMTMVASGTNKFWNLYNAASVANIATENLLSNISFSSNLVDATVELGIVFTDGLVIAQDATQSSNVTYYASNVLPQV